MSDTVIRKRSLPQRYTGTAQILLDGNQIYTDRQSVDLSGTQRTVSEGHQVSKLGKSNEDVGGDFHTFKSEVVHLSHKNVHISLPGGIQRTFTGPLIPLGARPLGEHEVDISSIQKLNALGATAISRVSPVDSNAEALTSISETLKDGLPSIPGISTWRDRTRIAKGGGSEYLNAQFGWIPLVSDMRSVAQSFKDAAKIIEQLKRDAGRNVRRRYEFPSETKSETLEDFTKDAGLHLTGGAALHGQYWGSWNGRKVVTRETRRKVWFSGAFTYHMPSSNTQLGKVISAYQMYDHLYGIGLTPDVVWNLTPWSWATDWFANTGDVLSNMSNAMLYGQILRYGYLMEQTTIIDRYSVRPDEFILGPGPYEAVVKTTVKRRVRANPYGFGITFDGLDAYQLSILAALGITKR